MDYLEKAKRVLDVEIFELQRLRDRLGEEFSRAVTLLKDAVDARGKIVVIGDPKRRDGREMLFRALGRFIDSLGGEYLTGEDVGTTLDDMDQMRVETRNVITDERPPLLSVARRGSPSGRIPSAATR